MVWIKYIGFKMCCGLVWLANRSWFFAAFLFIGFCIAGFVKNMDDLLTRLVFCAVIWGLDALFFKKVIDRTLHKMKDWLRSGNNL